MIAYLEIWSGDLDHVIHWQNLNTGPGKLCDKSSSQGRQLIHSGERSKRIDDVRSRATCIKQYRSCAQQIGWECPHNRSVSSDAKIISNGQKWMDTNHDNLSAKGILARGSVVVARVRRVSSMHGYCYSQSVGWGQRTNASVRCITRRMRGGLPFTAVKAAEVRLITYIKIRP